MQITRLIWDSKNIEHIAKHNLEPEEVEEVCFSEDPKPRIERGRYKRYYILGQTSSERYIFVVIEYLGKGEARPITAREMKDSEKKRFKRR